MKWFLGLVTTLLFVACKDDTIITEEKKTFPIPKSMNGVNFKDGYLWTTDLIGQAIFKVNPEDGKIIDYKSYANLGAGIDDVEILDDGTLIWTSPTKNFAGKTDPDGKSTLWLKQVNSVNPVTISDDQKYAYFCSSTGFPVSFYRVEIATGEATVLNDEIESLNGFDFAEDGFIYAPNPVNHIDNTGKLVKVNAENGNFEILNVTFSEEPLKKNFTFPTGVVVKANNIYVLESLNPKVYVVDKNTLEARLLHKLPLAFSDNITIDDQDNVYVTSFTGNQVAKINNDGTVKVLEVK